MKKRKRGRPSLGRKEHVEFRATAQEKEAYLKAATAMGLSLSDWIRLTLTAKTKQP